MLLKYNIKLQIDKFLKYLSHFCFRKNTFIESNSKYYYSDTNKGITFRRVWSHSFTRLHHLIPPLMNASLFSLLLYCLVVPNLLSSLLFRIFFLQLMFMDDGAHSQNNMEIIVIMF